jgi:hypothetical protein
MCGSDSCWQAAVWDCAVTCVKGERWPFTGDVSLGQLGDLPAILRMGDVPLATLAPSSGGQTSDGSRCMLGPETL